MSINAFSALVEDIYAICLNRDLLLKLLGDMADYFRCQAVGLHVVSQEDLHVVSEVTPQVSEAEMQRFAEQFSRLNDHIGEIILGRAAIPPEGLHILAAPGEGGDLDMISLVFSEGGFYLQLVLQRSASDALDFTQLRQKMQLLTPHLHRAYEIFQTMERLQGLSEGLEQLMDRLESGVVLFSGSGDAVFQNRRARSVVGIHLSLGIVSGRLFGHCSDETARLRELIANVIRDGKEGKHEVSVMKLRGDIVLVAVPLPPRVRAMLRDTPNVYAALLIGSDEQPSILKPELLQLLHGLTLPEARIAVALAGGRSVAEYCDESGISVHTARGYPKLALQKTGTRRQGELIAMLRNIPMLLPQERW